jgi:hypothetical protein
VSVGKGAATSPGRAVDRRAQSRAPAVAVLAARRLRLGRAALPSLPTDPLAASCWNFASTGDPVPRESLDPIAPTGSPRAGNTAPGVEVAPARGAGRNRHRAPIAVVKVALARGTGPHGPAVPPGLPRVAPRALGRALMPRGQGPRGLGRRAGAGEG